MCIAYRTPFRHCNFQVYNFALIFPYICILCRNFSLLCSILNTACRKGILVICCTILGPTELRIQFSRKACRSPLHLRKFRLTFSKSICKSILWSHLIICCHSLDCCRPGRSTYCFRFFSVIENLCFFIFFPGNFLKLCIQNHRTFRHNKLISLIFSQSYRNSFSFIFCCYFCALISFKWMDIETHCFSCHKKMFSFLHLQKFIGTQLFLFFFKLQKIRFKYNRSLFCSDCHIERIRFHIFFKICLGYLSRISVRIF